MLDFREISLETKPLFEEFFSNYKQNTSELNFTNLFIWRKYYNFKFAIIDRCLCILAFPQEGEPFAFSPIGFTYETLESVLIKLKEYFESNNLNFVLKRVDEDLLPCFKDIRSLSVEILLDRNNSDYIYNAQDLIDLAGRKYSPKRNHIQNFISKYQYEYLEYSSEYYDNCLALVEKSSTLHEKNSIEDCLKYYEQLNCKCFMLKIEDKIEAITAGEQVNDDTAVIHIEKANKKIDGIYAFINQKFCETNWHNLKYINREQDLGIEGLRKAKLQYSPVKLINKYTINLT